MNVCGIIVEGTLDSDVGRVTRLGDLTAATMLRYMRKFLIRRWGRLMTCARCCWIVIITLYCSNSNQWPGRRR